MSVGELGFALLCATWWALSLYVNCSPSPRLRRRDVLFLVPTYRFFVGKPQFVDHYLEYRLEGDQCAWKRIQLYAPKSWRSVMWGPHLIGPVILDDWTERLLHVLARERESPESSLAYQEVLAYVRLLPGVGGGAAVQFQLLRGRAHDPEASTTVEFRSEWHRTSI